MKRKPPKKKTKQKTTLYVHRIFLLPGSSCTLTKKDALPFLKVPVLVAVHIYSPVEFLIDFPSDKVSICDRIT